MYVFVVLVMFVNIINVGVDIVVMGDSVCLLLGGLIVWYVCLFVVFMFVL